MTETINQQKPESHSEKLSEKKKASPKLIFILGLVCGIVLVSLIIFILLLILSSEQPKFSQTNQPVKEEQNKEETKESSFDAPDKKIAEMKFFVMSFCPFGQQAEKGIIPVARLMGEKAKIEPHFVIYSNYGSPKEKYCLDKEAKYCSMHGLSEIKEDVRQLCLWKYQPEKWWDYVEKIDNTCRLDDIDTCWEKVAKEVGVNIKKIKKCFNQEAKDLLAEELKLNKKYGVRGSPQVFINDKEYSGSRSPEAYKQAICSGFKNPPKECQQKLEESGGSAKGGC